MTKTQELLLFMEGRGGVTRSTDLLDAGFSAGLIAALENNGTIERETRGVYVTAGTILDDFARVHLRWNRCVFSHGSALYLQGLSDRLPFHLEVTVPREYNTTSLATNNPDLIIYRANKTAYPLGITEVRSMSGIMVKAYDAERCICDLLIARRKDGIDIQLFAGAMDGYFRRKNKDIGKLSTYAKVLGVGDELHRYTEVLL
ncbi:MAG: type IV toxin-antitoxin system AbiEi family antitoxin domain-containing protein [Coriobacteriia bacterium]|nr:type IV toxin-antitoxin system AbiEi family antitoxin domain-containing protein [Coriobacteriia bacterium]